MSQDQPPAKRSRHESSESADSREKSDQYWFDDGNIVLQAGENLYRVHSSMFARHSEVFKDMFSMPKPSGKQAGAEIIDECPVVVLTDTEDDIENVLSIFYEANKIYNFRCELPVAVLGSMLRLGKKYAIPHLESEALFRLHNDYPTILKYWDYMYQADSLAMVEDDVAAIIDLAHEFQLFTVLPSAYADYLRAASPEALSSDYFLSTKAKLHCLVGYANILKFIKEQMANALCPPYFLPATSCTRSCKSWKVIKSLYVWVVKADGSFRIFEPPNDRVWPAALCLECRDEVKKFIENIREDFWTRLPTFFGLPA